MSLSGWMTQAVYVASETGRDSYGKATYETPRLIGSRVESSRRMVRTSKGEEAVSNHRIYSIVPILLTDRVWLPGRSPAQLELSNVPLNVSFSSDKVGSKTLYSVDL